METDVLEVPASDVVLVGAPFAFAATTLTADASTVAFLTHNVTKDIL
jgi:hypothetical protein